MTYMTDGVMMPALNVQVTNRSRETPSQSDTTRQQRQSSNVDQVLGDSFPASDPPSWTGAISRVAGRSNGDERVIRRIRADFLEMPGLCLTTEQARRLWGLDPQTCEALLNLLIDSRFLRRTDGGLFVLSTPRS
jgi:hypothetical protein